MITLGNAVISDEDLAVIAHIVHNETPEEWATRAFNYPKGGIEAVLGKIARYRDECLAAMVVPGYQTAAERMAQRAAEARIRDDQARADQDARVAAEEARLKGLITAEVARQLALRG